MKKLNSFMKSRAFIITLTLTFIALIIAGVTYAWFTWTSTDNTNITMQIGEYTVVTYTGGNAININNLAPVFNYTDGESTTFSLTNSNTDTLKEFKYNVYLDITSISNELKSTSLKFVLLDGSSNIVDQGDFSTASNGSTLTITENQTLPNGNSSYTFIIYIDGNNENNTNMMNKSLSGSLRVTVNRTEVDVDSLHVTTAIDYEYTLLNKEDTEYDIDYIVLNKYVGPYHNIQVPDTFVVNDKEYKSLLYIGWDGGYNDTTFSGNTTINSVILPTDYIAYYQEKRDSVPVLTNHAMYYLFKSCTSLVNAPSIPISVTNMNGTFIGCKSLVSAPTIPNSVTDMDSTFSGCTSLVNAPVIPNSVTSIRWTFRGCTSLVNAPEIPNSVSNLWQTFFGCTSLLNVPPIPDSVTSMNSTFEGCTSLVNAPVISNSVTNMSFTFSGCTSLVNAPVIPNSVTNLNSTFEYCTSLVNAPEIPDSVTYFATTFEGCTSLTGTIRINSKKISSNFSEASYHPFYETVKPITVEVPAGSTTYTKINNNKPDNVTVTTFTP